MDIPLTPVIDSIIMGKTKNASTQAKSEKVRHNRMSFIREGASVNPSQTSMPKSKDLAKQINAKASNGVESKKSSKKAKKEPTPEPSSDESESDEEISEDSSVDSDVDSESDSDSGSDSGSDAKSSVSEVNVSKSEKPKTNGHVKMDISSETVKNDDGTSESSDSSASSDEEDVARAPKTVNGGTKQSKLQEVRSSHDLDTAAP